MMDLSTNSDWHERLRSIAGWPDSRPLSTLIGTPGYSPPDLRELHILRAREAVNICDKIAIAGETLDENWIVVPRTIQIANRLQIFFGKDATSNVLVLGEQSDISGSVRFNGKNGLCVFGANTVHPSTISAVFANRNTTFFFGKSGSSNGLEAYISGDDRSIIIGDDCMTAQRPTIMTSDVHAIIDLETRTWFNKPADVIIEPHVWLGMGATVLKGCEIGFGAVVGTHAIVTQSVPRRCLAVGAPAKVVKSAIAWIRPLVPNERAIDEVIKAGQLFPDA